MEERSFSRMRMRAGYLRRFLAAVFSALFMLLSCRTPSFAADGGTSSVQTIGGATFIGEYADKLELSVDNDYFFRSDIMNPGDAWETRMEIRNTGKKDIEVSLLEIVNKLSDSLLLDVLDLKISLPDGTVVYDGKYSKTRTPVIDWIPLKAGQTLELLIEKSFPAECGNDYQAASFHTEWIFEVRAQEPESPDTGKTGEPSSPGDGGKQDPGSSGGGKKDGSSDKKDSASAATEKDGNVQTGDTTQTIAWILFLLIGSLFAASFFMAAKDTRLMQENNLRKGILDAAARKQDAGAEVNSEAKAKADTEADAGKPMHDTGVEKG